MNKEAFLNELRSKLSGLPQEDIDERVSFYREMIEDHVEDGATEEEAVSDIGPVDEVVKTIMAEIPLTKIVKTRAKNKQKKSMPVWVIILLVLGFPVWFPLLITVFAVVLSIFITVWAIIFSLYVTDFALGMSAIACILAAVVSFAAGKIALGFMCIGAALILAGITILFFFGIWYVVKGVLFLTKKMMIGIKSMFVGKESV